MTYERQDIAADFYAGNSKQIAVTVYKPDGNRKDITSSEITYAVFTDAYEIVLLKSSSDGAEHIEITDGPNGEFLIYLAPSDTVNINGTFRHHANVVDAYGDEETVFSGKINIFRSFARRFRRSSASAYLVGG
jgi:hypothetical protein